METLSKFNMWSTWIRLLQGLLTSENLALRNITPRGHACSHSLDDKRNNVENYKVKTESPCFEPQNLGASGEVVHHSAQDHVNVCINPKWRQLGFD